MSESTDVKPADQPINIKVNTQDGREMTFKVKRSTKFKKIIDAFADRESVQAQSIRFIFNGDRINPDQCPEDLDMEDGDLVDVKIEQSGGKYNSCE